MKHFRHGPSQHKLVKTLPVGNFDIGAEVEVEIVFSFLKGAPEQGPSYASGGQPADPDEVKLIRAIPLCNGKPLTYSGGFADMEQRNLDAVVETWLESDDGFAEACEVAMEE